MVLPSSRMDGFDRLTGCQGSISEPHLLLHQGFMFMADLKFTGLANGASKDFLIVVPENRYPHFRTAEFDIDSGPCDIRIFEDTTVSSNGTSVPIVNLNRASPFVSNVTIFHTPTITDDGDELAVEYLPATAPSKGGTSGEESATEWVFNHNRNYLIRLTNNSGGAIAAGLHLQFYDLSAA